ncbi:MAG: hypothetical protein R2848_17720 [Thermomicrobiales bacterium]
MKQAGVNRQDALLALVMRTLSVYGATVVVVVLTAALSGRPLFVAGAVAALIAMILGLIAIARQGRGMEKTIIRWAAIAATLAAPAHRGHRPVQGPLNSRPPTFSAPSQPRCSRAFARWR